MAIRAERLEVEVTANTKPAEKGLDQFSDKTEKSSGGMKALKAATIAFTGSAVAGMAGKVVMAASDLNETVSKTGVVFKDQTGQVTSYAQQMADKFGLPKAAVLDAASSFGLLGKAAGVQGPALSSMSTNLAGLAADAMSFYNVPLEQALGDFGSALSGESEPVKKYGILMNETAVQAEALALGLVKPTKNAAAISAATIKARLAQTAYNDAVKKHGKNSDEAAKAGLALKSAQDAVAKATAGTLPPLTEGQKVQARASLIAKGLKDANGDLARTQGSVSNRLKEVQGRIVNYSAAIGTKALPAVASLLEGVVGLMGGLAKVPKFIQENETAIKIVGGIITTLILPALVAWGVQSTIAAAKSVAAWVTSQAAAIASGWAHVGAAARVVGGWVAMGAAAVASGAQTVAIWALYKAEAVKGAAVWVAQQARVVASTVASAAVQTATMAATVARTVAGWVVMGAQSLIQAARMAAAWVIAMGPVGWVIAAVVALAVVIYKNWDSIKEYTVKVWGAVMGWLKSAWETIKGWIRAYFTAYKTVILAVWNGVKAAGQAVWNGIKAGISAVLSAIRSIVTSYFNTYRSLITGAWNAVKSITSSAWNGIKSVVSSAINGVLSIVRGVPGRIRSALGNLGGMLRSAGQSIINGLAQGIWDGLGNVTGAVKGVLQRARNLLPFSPAKEGPFSGKGWTLHSGRSISKALAQGIKDQTRGVRSAALGLAQAAVPSVGGITAPGVRFGRSAADSGRSRRAPGPTPDQIARQQGPGGSQTVVFNTYYPVAEKQSQTVNRSLQRVAALQTVA